MNRLSIFCLFGLLACLSEEKADLAKPTTFSRYFSDGYANTAVSIEEAPDKGFIILANSTVRNSDAEIPRLKILLIKTDQFGNEEWREHYPAIDVDTANYNANSLIILPTGGYLITGESIRLGYKRRLLLITVPETGDRQNPINYRVIPSPTYDVKGLATALGPAGNYLVMSSSISGDSIQVAELDKTTLAQNWKRIYSQGTTIVIPKLYYTEALPNGPFFYFGGYTQQLSGTLGGFVAKTELDASYPVNGITVEIGGTASNDFAGDFCQRGQDFGFVGHTDASGNGDPGDIAFYQVNSEGSMVNAKIYTSEIFNYPPGATPPNNNKKEVANSISSTSDGDFIILGTIDTYTGVLGAGNTDLFLMKVSGLGSKRWSQTFGSLQADSGNAVRQTSEGGFIVLGTSNFGSQNTILLIKTDKNGDVD